MYFKQADMLEGLEKEFVRDLMKLSYNETYKTGDIIFSKGQPCRNFYTLLEGQVKLTIGEFGHMVYIVSHTGEAFGWSSIIGRDYYTATAECVKQTELLRIDRKELQLLLNSDPFNGMRFFQQLAGILGNRLLNSYNMIFSRDIAEKDLIAGTGQLLQATEPV